MSIALRSLLVFLALMVISLVAVVAVGALLPRAHVAVSSARYPRPPQDIWDTISDYSAYPKWRTDVKYVEPLPGHNGLPAWREHGPNNNIPFEVVELQPPTRMVTRIADPKLPFGGTWILEVQPEGSGCRLTITENGEVSNPAFRFVSRFILGHNATMNQYLRALGRKYYQDTVPREEK